MVITPVNGRHFVCARHLGEIFTVVTRTANLFRNSASANEKFIKKIFNNQRIRLFFIWLVCAICLCAQEVARKCRRIEKLTIKLAGPCTVTFASQCQTRRTPATPVARCARTSEILFYFPLNLHNFEQSVPGPVD